MKNQFTPLYFLFFIAFFLVSNSANPPDGRTGAPGEGNCTNCHTGNNPNNFAGTLSIEGLPDQLEPNATYQLSIIAKRTEGTPTRAGFQLVALDESNQNTGNFSNSGANAVITNKDGRTYFEHNPALKFENTEEVSWMVDWTAPANPNTAITFYANSVFGNGGGSTGDANVEVSISKMVQAAAGEAITITGTAKNVSCFEGIDGAISVDIAGGTGNYSYAWSNDSKEQNIENIGAGEYTLTVTDDSGETSSRLFAIAQPSELIIDVVEITHIDCNNTIGFATVAATGGTQVYNYAWNTIQGAAVSLPVGTHTVTVTDGNGCTATNSLAIIKDVLLPEVNAGSPKTIDCKGPLVDLEGSASQGDQFSYQWSTVSGFILAGETSLMPTVEAGGLYTLLVTNNTTGCSASSQVDVTENNTPPLANAGTTKQLSCAEESISLDGSSSANGATIEYQWSTENGNITSGVNTTSPRINQTGEYTLNVLDTSNGCSSSSTVTVIQDVNMPTAFAGEIQTLDCNTNVVTLNGNGTTGVDYVYVWETEDGKIESGETTLTPTVSASGTYRLTVRNRTNGCDASSSVTVSALVERVVADAGIDLDLSCSVDLITINGSSSSNGSDIVYEWSTADGNILSGNNASIININASGTYSLTVRDTITGCTDTDEVLITQEFRNPEVTLAPTAMLTCETSEIKLQASLKEADPNLTYQWRTENGGNIVEGGNTLTPTINSAGVYSLVVFNTLSNCIGTASIEVSQEGERPTIAIEETMNGIEVTVRGGMEPYTYRWSSDSTITTSTISSLPTGEYSITVTDAIGCSSSADFEVMSTSVPTISSLTSFDLYPNPAKEGIQINASFNQKEKGTIHLINSLGKTVWTQQFDTNNIQLRLATKLWEGGIYFMVLQTAEGIKVEEVVILK